MNINEINRVELLKTIGFSDELISNIENIDYNDKVIDINFNSETPDTDFYKADDMIISYNEAVDYNTVMRF